MGDKTLPAAMPWGRTHYDATVRADMESASTEELEAAAAIYDRAVAKSKPMDYVHQVDLDAKRIPAPMLCGARANEVRYKCYARGELARIATPPAPKCAGCLAAI